MRYVVMIVNDNRDTQHANKYNIIIFVWKNPLIVTY